MGHDNHGRLSKLYAWEEKKGKTPWGAQTVDHEKIAAAAVEAMKTAGLNRFLVVCALVSDLYCPTYNPGQSLEKNSNLASTALRYKVDIAKVVTTVRAELSELKTRAKHETQTAKKPTSTKTQQPKASTRKPSKKPTTSEAEGPRFQARPTSFSEASINRLSFSLEFHS